MEVIGDIKIINTPGHTVGHVCLLYKDIMFVGDLFRTKNGEIIPSLHLLIGIIRF